MEMVVFSCKSGMGGGAYAGGGGIDESCCGMAGGARVGGGRAEISRSGTLGAARLGICGGLFFMAGTGLRVDTIACCRVDCIEGPSRSSGKRKEFIVIDVKEMLKCLCIFETHKLHLQGIYRSLMCSSLVTSPVGSSRQTLHVSPYEAVAMGLYHNCLRPASITYAAKILSRVDQA